MYCSLINFMFLEHSDSTFRLNDTSILSLKDYRKLLRLIIKDLIYNPSLTINEKKEKMLE